MIAGWQLKKKSSPPPILTLGSPLLVEELENLENKYLSS